MINKGIRHLLALFGIGVIMACCQSEGTTAVEKHRFTNSSINLDMRGNFKTSFGIKSIPTDLFSLVYVVL